MSKQPVRYEQSGPFGSQADSTFKTVFDETDTVKTVRLGTGYVVDGIGFDSVDNTGRTASVYYGSRGHESHKINLTSTEYITQISGFEGDFTELGNRRHIVQIKIHTNLAPNGYGPYGRMLNCKNVKPFISTEGPTTGFFGVIGKYLEAIGVIVKV